MCPLPTYQMPVAIKLCDSLIVAQTVDQPESNIAALQPVIESEVEAIDMSFVFALCQELSIAQESNNSIVPTLNTRIILISRPISFPRKMMNDISENPSRSPLSCPVPHSHKPIILVFNIRTTFVSPPESVLLHYYRHERPIAIVRPVLMRQSNQRTTHKANLVVTKLSSVKISQSSKRRILNLSN